MLSVEQINLASINYTKYSQLIDKYIDHTNAHVEIDYFLMKVVIDPNRTTKYIYIDPQFINTFTQVFHIFRRVLKQTTPFLFLSTPANLLKIWIQKCNLKNKYMYIYIYMSTLLSAINSGNIDLINKAIELGALPDKYALNYAIKTDKIDIINRVIEVGALPDKYTLNTAIETGIIDIVKRVIEIGALPDKNSLNTAIEIGKIDIINSVIEVGALPDENTLHYAIDVMGTKNKDIINSVIKSIIKSGALLDKNIFIIAELNDIDIVPPLGYTNKFHIETTDTSAYKDATKFITLYNPISQEGTKGTKGTKGIYVKIVDIDICPPELQPIDDKCPSKFPFLSRTSNCCYKNMAVKKMATIWKKDTSIYKNNVEFYSNRQVYVYTPLQIRALQLYSNHGDKLLSNFTTCGFKINRQTLEYFYLNSDAFYDLNEESLKDYCITFYKNIVSCFKFSLDYHIILYRNISGHVTYDKGTYILINHFISTSIDKDFAEKFIGGKSTLLIIYIPKDSLICPIFDHSYYPHEKEVLLNCGSIFYINSSSKDLDDSRKTIEMTLVGRKELLGNM